jgi:hypothetical protein
VPATTLRPPRRRGNRRSPPDVLPFGKHKGRHLCDLPIGYLHWLDLQHWLDDDLAEAVEDELARRRDDIARRLAQVEQEADEAEQWPGANVEGIELNGPEQSVLWDAAALRELVIPLWLPCASELPTAWKRVCRAKGWRHLERVATFQQEGNS